MNAPGAPVSVFVLSWTRLPGASRQPGRRSVPHRAAGHGEEYRARHPGFWSMACSPNPAARGHLLSDHPEDIKPYVAMSPSPEPLPLGYRCRDKASILARGGAIPFLPSGEGWDEGERPRLTPHLYLPQGGRWWPSRGAASDAIHDGARHRPVRVPPLWLESSTP